MRNSGRLRAGVICAVTPLLLPSAVVSLGATNVGMNLGFNNDWSTAEPWTDATKMFRTWGTFDQPWVENPSLQLDANGYPLQPASAMATLPNYPDGTYKLSYRGTATVTLSGMGTVTNLVRSGDLTTADVVLDHKKSSLLALKVTGQSSSSPLRDLSLTIPGARPGQTFTDDFIRRLQPFSTIRLMDWAMTNNNPVQNWSGRITPQTFTQTGPNGVALEYQIALANEAKRDPWLNVPVSASDDYVRNMARLIHSELQSGRTVYVEYSNELWNGHFEQYQTNLANAWANTALTATDDKSRAGQQAAFRTKQIGDIFRQEFGTDASCVKMVLAGQAASNSFIPAGMSYLQSTYGKANSYVDAIAIAPYVDIPATADTAGLTLDGLFSAMNTQLDTEVTTWIKNHSRTATQYGVQLMAYEGGQGLTPSAAGGVNASLKLQAQYDPRMGDLTTKLLNIWAANGGGLFNDYSFIARDASSGFWGALSSMSDLGSPKWDALLRASLPLGDATLDGVVNDADYQVLLANFYQSGKWWEQGDFNGDGLVNHDDLTLLDLGLARYRNATEPSGISAIPSITPEPAASLAAIAWGGYAMCRRRTRPAIG